MISQYAKKENDVCVAQQPQSEGILSQIEHIKNRLDGLVNASERAK
jgi:hypothetical protein